MATNYLNSYKNRISTNSRFTAQSYVNQVRQELAQKQKLREEEKKKEEEEKQSNWFTRSLATVGDFFGNVITGVAKSFEGIIDLGASLVGGIGGWFDKDFQDDVKSWVSNDWVGSTVGNFFNEITEDSYLNDSKIGNIIEGVASGIGQMLPAVAVTVITGGAGASAFVSQAASLATLGISAAGNSTESAFQEGADYWKGLGYGVLSGGVEVATEKLTGGLTSGIFGKGILDGVGKTVAKTGARRVIQGAIEEGAEEVVAELVNPALKSIYKGKEAFQEYGDSEYWGELQRQAS